MTLPVLTAHKAFRPTIGALLAITCGLGLWQIPLGDAWINASYDYLFRFGARPITQDLVLILMDNLAYDHFQQTRGQPWDRSLHAQLFNKLADDGCSLVVADTFLHRAADPLKDRLLVEALGRLPHVVLTAKQVASAHPSLDSAAPTLPNPIFLNAARTNWGVAWLDPDVDLTVRRHWPFPGPGHYPSLPETAARLAGAPSPEAVERRWIRYYGATSAWPSLSYPFAMRQGSNYFRDKIVFIGNEPNTSLPDDEQDECRTPYTRWTGGSSGGVRIMVSTFLNLMNKDWLRRPPAAVEVAVLLLSGAALGIGLSRARPMVACVWAAGAGLAIALGSISGSYFTNYWFPWMIIMGGQVPCALAWTILGPRPSPILTANLDPAAKIRTAQNQTTDILPPLPRSPGLPDSPDYELFEPAIGEGAYGKVWLARNAIGQWQALKVVYLAKFQQNARPFEREFNGIRRYKPVSERHPGLLRVDFVSRKKDEGYFYYVMELADAHSPGWEQNPILYKPLDLASLVEQVDGHRLPVKQCLAIGRTLTAALEFLHDEGFTHRDIKPRNIIFVGGRPKLADVGLVAEIRATDQERTWVGTPGYMPPIPEPPGTLQADIYALGMVLYVISSGRGPASYRELAKAFEAEPGRTEFAGLQAIILRACHPDCGERYRSAAALGKALDQAIG